MCVHLPSASGGQASAASGSESAADKPAPARYEDLDGYEDGCYNKTEFDLEWGGMDGLPAFETVAGAADDNLACVSRRDFEKWRASDRCQSNFELQLQKGAQKLPRSFVDGNPDQWASGWDYSARCSVNHACSTRACTHPSSDIS